jgi:hypothetical protein
MGDRFFSVVKVWTENLTKKLNWKLIWRMGGGVRLLEGVRLFSNTPSRVCVN